MDRLAMKASESRFTAFIGSLSEVMAIKTARGLIGRAAFSPAASARAWSRWPRSRIRREIRRSISRCCISWAAAGPMRRAEQSSRVGAAHRSKITAGKAWIIDDTGFPKKGRHSVGVARQYCGQLGKQETARSPSRCRRQQSASLPMACRLYLPKAWATIRPGAEGRRPEEAAIRNQAPDRPGADRASPRSAMPEDVADGSGYGVDTRFRSAMTALG